MVALALAQLLSHSRWPTSVPASVRHTGMPKSTWAANWIGRKNTTIGKCTASRMRRETLCGCIMQQWQGENRGNCISLGQGRIVLSIVCQTLSIDSIQHARALRNRLVVYFDRLKPCPPDVRLPTTPPTSTTTICARNCGLTSRHQP